MLTELRGSMQNFMETLEHKMKASIGQVPIMNGVWRLESPLWFEYFAELLCVYTLPLSYLSFGLLSSIIFVREMQPIHFANTFFSTFSLVM